jgi:aquaporin Z
MLVFTVGCNVLSGSGPVWAVTSIACTLMVMIYGCASISGSNFNPAVSLSLAVAGKMTWETALNYIFVQIFGGFLGACSYALLFWNVFDGGPAAGHTMTAATMAEAHYTFMLCFVVLNCAASKDGGNQYFGLAIAFVVVAGGYGAGAISGGCFNPAVALGIDFSSIRMGGGWSLYYLVAEFVGAGLAGLVFNFLRSYEDVPEEASSSDQKPAKSASMSQKFVSEFLGTFYLVLTVGLNVLGGSKAPVWSIAASLMAMIFALGSVSGANFNPAVSVCLAVTGRPKVLDFMSMLMYIVAQMLGGVAAGFTYSGMHGGKSFGLAPGPGHGLVEAGVVEVAYTFLLCYVVCCVATTSSSTQNTGFFGFIIGSCVTAGGYAIGAVSGGSLNPAVSFGIAAPHLLNGDHFGMDL